MAEDGKQARRFLEWTQALRDDVQTTFELLDDPGIAPPGRRQLAAALSYFVTQLDLIPDHEKAGAIDDAFVLRVAYGLAAEHAAKASTRASSFIARQSNEEEEVRAFLGDTIFAKLRRYVVELNDKQVRGRTPDQIVSDAKARAELHREVEQGLRKVPDPTPISDADAAQLEVTVKSYLQMKLKA